MLVFAPRRPEMKLAIAPMLFAVAFLFATAAFGQGLQTIKPIPPSVSQSLQVDQDAVARRQLEIDNRKLREENERLKAENAALNARIVELTTLGGSEVRAYCADSSTSRNTAGVSESCGPYACNPVSGLCKVHCAVSTDCATGRSCDDRDGVCKTQQALEQSNE